MKSLQVPLPRRRERSDQAVLCRWSLASGEAGQCLAIAEDLSVDGGRVFLRIGPAQERRVVAVRAQHEDRGAAEQLQPGRLVVDVGRVQLGAGSLELGDSREELLHRCK